MPRVSPNIGVSLIKFLSFLAKDTKVMFLVYLFSPPASRRAAVITGAGVVCRRSC